MESHWVVINHVLFGGRILRILVLGKRINQLSHDWHFWPVWKCFHLKGVENIFFSPSFLQTFTFAQNNYNSLGVLLENKKSVRERITIFICLFIFPFTAVLLSLQNYKLFSSAEVSNNKQTFFLTVGFGIENLSLSYSFHSWNDIYKKAVLEKTIIAVHYFNCSNNLEEHPKSSENGEFSLRTFVVCLYVCREKMNCFMK